jgi:tetratricopeptide (TPR) repeat protein
MYRARNVRWMRPLAGSCGALSNLRSRTEPRASTAARVVAGRASVTRTLALAVALALLALLMHAPSGARAQHAEDYEALVRAAVVEFNQGHWDEAHALFSRAHALSPNARTWRGLGISAFESRHYVEAIADLEAALADPNKPLTAEQRAEVSGVLKRAREFVSVYRVNVRPSDAQVMVDGTPTKLANSELYLDPGPHSIVVRAPGYEERMADIRASAGAQQELQIDLRVADTAEEKRADSGEPARAEPPRRRVWTWVLAGSTVAAGGSALAAGLLTLRKHDDLEQRASEGRCTETRACEDLGASGRRLERTTNALLGVSGALLVGTGIAFFLEGRRHESAARATLTVSPHGVGLHGHF